MIKVTVTPSIVEFPIANCEQAIQLVDLLSILLKNISFNEMENYKMLSQYFKERCVFVSAQGIQVYRLLHGVPAQQKP